MDGKCQICGFTEQLLCETHAEEFWEDGRGQEYRYQLESKQGVIDAIDEVLVENNTHHASRAIAIQTLIADLREQLRKCERQREDANIRYRMAENRCVDMRQERDEAEKVRDQHAGAIEVWQREYSGALVDAERALEDAEKYAHARNNALDMVAGYLQALKNEQDRRETAERERDEARAYGRARLADYEACMRDLRAVERERDEALAQLVESVPIARVLEVIKRLISRQEDFMHAKEPPDSMQRAFLNTAMRAYMDVADELGINLINLDAEGGER